MQNVECRITREGWRGDEVCNFWLDDKKTRGWKRAARQAALPRRADNSEGHPGPERPIASDVPTGALDMGEMHE
jgi:hypothetical protein